MSEWVNIGRPGPFGNRFIIGRDGDRAEVVRKDAEWIMLPAQIALRRRIRLELHGKRLWCPGCRGTLADLRLDRGSRLAIVAWATARTHARGQTTMTAHDALQTTGTSALPMAGVV